VKLVKFWLYAVGGILADLVSCVAVRPPVVLVLVVLLDVVVISIAIC